MTYSERLKRVVIAGPRTGCGERGNLMRLLHFVRNDNLPNVNRSKAFTLVDSVTSDKIPIVSLF